MDVSSSCGTHRDPSLHSQLLPPPPYLTLKPSIVIEGGIFVSHGIWLIRTRKLRAKAKAAGCTFDDLPESETYHVDVPRKGSIAASRDVEHVEIERRGSMALARERDLEAGRRSMGMGRDSVAKNIILEETESIGKSSDSINLSVKKVSLTPDGQGVEETDYGTMATKGETKRAGMKRPGYVRQATSESLFKDPIWGKKGLDE